MNWWKKGMLREGKNNEIGLLIEWAVWAQLESKVDFELILIKGHLLLDKVIETVLKREGINDCETFSFFRKINVLETFGFQNNLNLEFIKSSLLDINRIRNKAVHEVRFTNRNVDLEQWASNVLSQLPGNKFSKITSRTKIVHSFSVLSKNILDLRR
jgi:hypothetical protein